MISTYKSINILAFKMLLFVLTAVLLCGCSDEVKDNRLLHADEIVSDSALVALRQLKNIDPNSLSETERQYRNLLLIKAADKAYIPHKSDSLIMSVVEYTEKYSGLDWRPEALYYAGRVYSDLGDYPTALKYFHDAIDMMPTNNKSLNLRHRTLSQSGRLLDKIGLYNEAMSAINQAIDACIKSNDTIPYIYDLQLAGDISLRMDSLDNAYKYLAEALKYENKIPEHINAKTRMSIAAVKYFTHELDSALIFIRSAVDSVPNLSKPTAMAYAAKIYYAKGITDTAFLYAKKLLSPNMVNNNRHIGYQILLQKNMRLLSPSDSIESYISKHAGILNQFLNDSQRQLAVTQQAAYNYKLHEKKRIQAETSRKKMQIWLLISGVIVFALMSLVFYLKYRQRDQFFKLKNAIETIEQLQKEIIKDQGETPKSDVVSKPEATVPDLRIQLRKKYLDLFDSIERTTSSERVILDQALYEILLEKIKNRQILKENDPIWIQIETVIVNESPAFKKNLRLLCASKIKTEMWQTAMLIKFGMSPTEISELLARTKSTITMRRITLGELCFDKKLDTVVLDSIIRSL